MKKHCLLIRATSYATLLLLLQAVILPGLVSAQVSKCGYDVSNPTIGSARKNFKITNYPCAEEELNLFLEDSAISIQQRADAHVLLASVYYAMMRDDDNKSAKVTEQFVKAFRAFHEWKGDTDIKSPEFLELMDHARQLASQEPDPEEIVAEKLAIDIPDIDGGDEGKPWYKKWWAMGLGIGVIAGVAVAVGGGSSDEPPPDRTLGDFPGTPDAPVQ